MMTRQKSHEQFTEALREFSRAATDYTPGSEARFAEARKRLFQEHGQSYDEVTKSGRLGLGEKCVEPPVNANAKQGRSAVDGQDGLNVRRSPCYTP